MEDLGAKKLWVRFLGTDDTDFINRTDFTPTSS